MQIYESIQGDTFDNISKKVYGSERKLQKLLDANPDKIATVVFEAGAALRIPKLTEEEKAAYSPAPWRA